MRLICTRCNYVFDTEEKKSTCPYCGEKNTLIEVQKAEELVPDGRK